MFLLESFSHFKAHIGWIMRFPKSFAVFVMPFVPEIEWENN